MTNGRRTSVAARRTGSTQDFRVKEGEKVDLADWPTLVDPVYRSKDDYHALLAEHVARLSDLQQKLYASQPRLRCC